jgi:regulator of sigma E protease
LDNLFIIIAAFIFTIALLVAIHEFGHFWVARKLNVKVLRFSIGFGKPLYRFNGAKDETEYVIASIPLGGYVKMLDEREGEVPEGELDRAFNRQSVYKRFAIVFAGPLVNFLFAVFAFWLMFVIGIQGVKPVMGKIAPESIAWESGLRSGDHIIAVDGSETPTLSSVYEELLTAFIERKEVRLTLADQRNILLPLDTIDKYAEPVQLQQLIGLSIKFPTEDVFLGEVLPDSPAFNAGLKAGDQIMLIDGQPVEHWRDLVHYVIGKPDQEISLLVRRAAQDIPLSVKVGSVNEGGQTIGRIGVKPASVTPLPESMFAVQQYGLLAAIPKSIEKTWELSILTLKMLGKIIIGEASIKNISGPIAIAEVAGQSAQMGFESFLRFLAIISLSLGVINLLPIPMLDGGHLLYYLVEIIKGSPVSEEIQAFGLKIGIVLLAALMSVAIFNDLTRLMN